MEKFLDLIGFTRLHKSKAIQLTEQSLADARLREYVKVCPDIVANFLLRIRQDSRRDQQAVLDASITDKVFAIETEIDNSRRIYREVNQAHKSDYVLDPPERIRQRCEYIRTIRTR